jgi:hypothetical protein
MVPDADLPQLVLSAGLRAPSSCLRDSAISRTCRTWSAVRRRTSQISLAVSAAPGRARGAGPGRSTPVTTDRSAALMSSTEMYSASSSRVSSLRPCPASARGRAGQDSSGHCPDGVAGRVFQVPVGEQPQEHSARVALGLPGWPGRLGPLVLRHQPDALAELTDLLRRKPRGVPGQVRKQPEGARVRGSQVLRQVRPRDGEQVRLVHAERRREQPELRLAGVAPPSTARSPASGTPACPASAVTSSPRSISRASTTSKPGHSVIPPRLASPRRPLRVVAFGSGRRRRGPRTGQTSVRQKAAMDKNR